ncbi:MULTISPECIES: archaetidylinositol phosphate synthase [Metallosphaera]|uniref:Archaetidylinositol phosphate synthase n=3 Tax=Metallosphaera TaxID=41980 RepID=A4YHZ9_METS5|nr:MULTISPECIES: archaetidylinositol phosphate synthase [Metallosphaera]ABP96051.1 CDP-alcohol phosphatidyltransferase [Metallosphaera sedula DSM 5348]AIM28035.1 CDP-alcohol phosphatidyltransferase [Metallosphaera sedula]AKV74868.1 CDP-alcohol phosphatidyltransferase [Metallosphaera sedula]AKV77105.1 CDP-alcohol phosphatidyltransferase [Metallosphaera sedula]AKV79356.1 CDP-alcohol phosphatidyltransferase [Metallosphaera sedula]
MITNLRSASKKVLRPMASALVKAGFTGNQVTALGLVMSLVYLGVIYFTRNPLLGLLTLAISSLLDALDGEVARMRGLAGPKGSFLDSSFDRLEDTLFIGSLVLLGFPPLLTAILVGISLSISYLRAKAESLGIKAEGKGLIERGERLILVGLILLFLPFLPLISTVIFYGLFVASIITLGQRFHLVMSALP